MVCPRSGFGCGFDATDHAHARDALPPGGLSKGRWMPKLKVLFVCMSNSCRSQMAEGWTRQLKGDLIEPYSGGLAPQDVEPLAVKAMAELGIDIGKQRSKHVNELASHTFDCVVTLCDDAGKMYPVFPDPTKHVHVGFDDPQRLAKGAKAEPEVMMHYRRVRNEIRNFVATLPHGLTNPPTLPRARPA
jgi:arsenate reductase (thioredoxin)